MRNDEKPTVLRRTQWKEKQMATSNSMERKADGAIRRMVYIKGVLSHPCYSMFIQTTNIYTRLTTCI